jgi:peptidoglycan/LPS O-acetylase OafA/YrhL
VNELRVSRDYRPDVDGLRAIAILLVVGYHYFGLSGGYVGVDVFFVISGYLITGLLLEALDRSSLRLSEFYSRRARRILPPLSVVLVTSFVVGWRFLLPFDLRVLARETLASALYVINFQLWHEAGYFDVAARSKPLLHLWSLAVEEQFYLVWPALLLLGHWCRRRTDFVIVVVLIASFLINIVTVQSDQPAAFYSPLSRIWELAAGGLLAQLEMTRGSSLAPRLRGGTFLGLALILGAACLYGNGAHFPGLRALAPVVGAGLVLAGGPEAALNRRILASRPMVYLGRVSYSLYLWHWVVLVLAGLIFWQQHGWQFRGVCLLISCALTVATFHLWEQPIRAIPVTRDNTWKFLSLAVGSAGGIAAVALLVLSGTFARASDVKLITRAYRGPDPSCLFAGLDAAAARTAAFAPCEAIRFAQRPIVIVIGDSHADALYGGLRRYLDARRINLIEYAVSGCEPLTTIGATPACAATYEYIFSQVRRRAPDLVVLFAHHLTWTQQFPSYPQLVIHNAAALLQGGARHVLLVGQMPIWEATLPAILNREYLRLGQQAPARMFTGLVRDSTDLDTVMSQASAAQGVPYYSLKEKLCDPRGCQTKVGNDLPADLIVYDTGHLTTAGARYLLQTGLGQKIESFLVPN